MMHLLQKRYAKLRPGRLAKRAILIAERLGEDFSEVAEREPGKLLPPLPPVYGKRYEAGPLHIENTHWSVTVCWEGKMVFRHDGLSTRRFNYGADWIAEMNATYDELTSKDKRRDAALWRDLD